MSSKFNFAARASALQSKIKVQEFKEIKLPENSQDYTTHFKSASAAVAKSSNIYTIDVFPNFIPILMSVLFHCVQLSPVVDSRNHAKFTTPTFVAYCLTIIYGHFLLHDMYIRPTPSPYAQDYLNEDTKTKFADRLLSLPVPSFLEPLLKTFTCTTAPHTPNVAVCPSAAGFTIHKHFGRFFPINIFTAIHDLSASINSRCPPKATNYAVFSTTVFSINNSSDTPNNFEYTIGHFLGALFAPSANSIVDGKAPNFSSSASLLRQAFESAFNPVLSRDYTRRSTLATLNIVPQSFPSQYCNPYDILFCYSPTNFAEINVVLDTISAALSSSSVCSHSLGQLITAPSGSAILRHAYSTYALPTWHTQPIPSALQNADPDDIKNQPKESKLEAKDYAAKIRFLVPKNADMDNASKAHTPFSATMPSSSKESGTPKVSPQDEHLSLLTTEDVDISDAYPISGHFIEFDDDRDVAPLLLVLDPIETDTENAWMSSSYGMIIESFEIDASAVPLPNAEGNSSFQNSQLFSSAVPFSKTFRATNFNGTLPFSVLPRTIEKKGSHKAASYKFDFSVLHLPRYLLKTYDDFVPARTPGIPGFTYLDNVIQISAVAEFFGFKIRTQTVTDKKITLPRHTTNDVFKLWSPYSHTPFFPDFGYTGRSRHGTLEEPPKPYFIANLRTIFGTDPALMEMQHYNLCTPIA
nr:capsid protein [Sarcosphaera coronaria partitivirus]